MFNKQPLDPESCLLNPPFRATPNHETNQIPKYFQNYFMAVQICRVSLEVLNFGSFELLIFKIPQVRIFLDLRQRNESSCETHRRRGMHVFPGGQGCPPYGSRNRSCTVRWTSSSVERRFRMLQATPENPLIIFPDQGGETPVGSRQGTRPNVAELARVQTNHLRPRDRLNSCESSYVNS
jgi:hypothetical protein